MKPPPQQNKKNSISVPYFQACQRCHQSLHPDTTKCTPSACQYLSSLVCRWSWATRSPTSYSRHLAAFPVVHWVRPRAAVAQTATSPTSQHWSGANDSWSIRSPRSNRFVLSGTQLLEYTRNHRQSSGSSWQTKRPFLGRFYPVLPIFAWGYKREFEMFKRRE